MDETDFHNPDNVPGLPIVKFEDEKVKFSNPATNHSNSVAIQDSDAQDLEAGGVQNDGYDDVDSIHSILDDDNKHGRVLANLIAKKLKNVEFNVALAAKSTRISQKEGRGTSLCCVCCKRNINSIDISKFQLGEIQEIWPYEADVKDENEKEEYREAIMGVKSQYKEIGKELLLTSRLNFFNRLEILCQIVTSNSEGYTICSDVFLGQLSETALHAALLYNNTEAAGILIKHGGKMLIMKTYTHIDYFGASAIHLAVVNGSISLVRELLQHVPEPEDRENFLHSRATGKFFRETFNTSELPLTLAVWRGDQEIFEELINAGAQLDYTEEFSGNNIIHSLVEFSKVNPELAVKMYQIVINSECSGNWWCRKQQEHGEGVGRCSKVVLRKLKCHLLSMKNKDGYTPILLAAKLALYDMLNVIINTEDVYCFTQWTYGPASYTYYDMTEIDSFSQRPNAIELLSFNTDDKVLKCLSITPIAKLMKLKWSMYWFYYIIWAIIHFIIMIFLTTSTVFRPLKQDIGNSTNYSLNYDTILASSQLYGGLFIVDCVAVFYCSMVLCFELFECILIIKLIRERYNTSCKYYHKSPWCTILKFDEFRCVFLVFAITIICWVATVPVPGIADSAFRSIALIFGWNYCLFFFKGLAHFGFFVHMVWRMISTDMLKFTFVFFLSAFGFSCGFYGLYQVSSPVPDSVKDLGSAAVTAFRLMNGLTEFDILTETTASSLAIAMFFGFVLIFNLLLINMLIAAFSDTYSNVSKQRDILWRKLQALCMLIIERRLPHNFRSTKGLTKRKIQKNDKEEDHWFLAVQETCYNK